MARARRCCSSCCAADLWPTPLGRESRTYHLDPDAGPQGSPQPAGSKQRIAYVGPERQDRYLRRDWNLTVTQVVTTGLFDEDIPLTRANRVQSARVTRLLKRFALWSLRRRRFLTLSYGQRRRVLIARALAGDPAVMLLDEVFNGLDKSSSRLLRAALEQAGTRGPAWILSTHRAVELPSSVTHSAHVRAAGSSRRVLSAGSCGSRRGRPVRRSRRVQSRFLQSAPSPTWLPSRWSGFEMPMSSATTGRSSRVSTGH